MRPSFSGFTLLEMIIYIHCSLLLTGCVGHLVITVHKEINERLSYTQNFVKLAVAYTLLREDIQKAYREKHCWKLQDKTGFVYYDATSDCGWAIEKGRLLRSTGLYSKQYQIWARRAVSVILDNADTLLCEYRYHGGTLVGICVTLAVKHKKTNISVDGFIAIKKCEDV